MYLGKRKILDIKKYEEYREKCIEYKTDAIDTAFSELDGLLNITAIAEQYFNRSRSWFSQRLHGCLVQNKAMQFKESECHELAEAFRDIAMRLTAHADEIDAAKMD